MAAVNYAGLLTAYKTIFEADARLAGCRVYVEEDPQFGLMDVGSCISIFLLDRKPTPNQSLSYGKRTRWHARVCFVCIYFSVESFHKAEIGRDALLGQLELVLMDNRTISSLVDSSWLEGGSFFSAKDDSGANVFAAAAETIITAEVSAISP